MHHLLVTRKAASTIGIAWRYFKAKKIQLMKQQANPLYKEMLQRQISFSYLD